MGIDADVCRAVAAAVFGDATKVKFSQLNAKERFTALQSGEVDVLSRNTTWTSSRDAGMGMVFAGVTYYDTFNSVVVPAWMQMVAPSSSLALSSEVSKVIGVYFRLFARK